MLETSARLLRLLTVLQARRSWTGDDLAERLEVTPRTLRRDLEKLRGLGYVITSTTGPGGGYRLEGGARMAPLTLDDAEAVAVTLALKNAVDTFTGQEQVLLRALMKVHQLLPDRLRVPLGGLDQATLALPGGASPVDVDVLMALASACRDHEQARFGYRDHTGKPTARATEPLQLVRSGQRRWYLVAWDLEREDWRTFRVDRIAAPVAVGPRVPAREFPGDVSTYVTDAISRAPYSLQAEFVLTGSLAELQPRVQSWMGVLQPMRGDRCLFTTGAESAEGVLCHLLLIGAPFQLRKPRALGPQLSAAVQRLAQSV